jgi:hypothetical protein
LPKESTPSSKFDIGTSSASLSLTAKKAVTLKSIAENETVKSTKPQLFGDGPAGTTITITVHSTATVSAIVKVNSDGSWNWTPPAGLTPGNHTVTLAWKDATGILHTLTRDFVVSAAEGPSFVASPSAAPLITLPKVMPSPSAIPKIYLPSTSSGIPKSGSVAPTLIGAAAGILLIIGAFVLAF